MKPVRASRFGFSLVETVLALGIAAFCLVALMGTLSFGLQGTRKTTDQTAAVGIAMNVVADLKATSSQHGSTSTGFHIPIPDPGASLATASLYIDDQGNAGSINSSPTSTALYRVTLTFTPPTGTTQRAATAVRVLVSWPALADSNPSVLPHSFQGSWETMINLDRN